MDRRRDLFPLPVPEEPILMESVSSVGSRKKRRYIKRVKKAQMAILATKSVNAAWNGGTLAFSLSTSNYSETGLKSKELDGPQYAARASAAHSIASVVDVASCRRGNPTDAAAAAEFQECMSGAGGSAPNSLWLDLQKTSLPPKGKVGTAELLNLLPPEICRVYESEELLLKPAEEREAQKVKPFCGVKVEQYGSVISSLCEVGFVQLQEKKPRIINGIFSVPKDKIMQRLIIDGRPANAVFTEPPHVELPTPSDLAALSAPEQTRLFICKSDMDNFYHRISMPPWMQQYFGLPKVRVAGPNGKERSMWPVVAVLPMGWSHSVYLAQVVHERLTDAALCDPLLRIQGPESSFDIGSVKHGQYIDDYFSIGISRKISKKYLDRVVEKCAELRIPAKESKLIQPGEKEVTILGMDVSESGFIFPSRIKFEVLVAYTWDFLKRNKWKPQVVKKLLGHWAWNLLLRRPIFSVLAETYKFAALPDENVARRPSNQMRRELYTLVGLSPFIQARITRPYAEFILCTDASLRGGGVVYCRSPSVFPHATRTDLSSRVQFVREQKWHTAIKHKWRSEKPIHILEGEALVLGLKWFLRSQRNFGRRIIVFLDNDALVGAIRKGRSSVPDFNIICRKVMALTLAGDLYLEVYYIPSKENPADEPSRSV